MAESAKEKETKALKKEREARRFDREVNARAKTVSADTIARLKAQLKASQATVSKMAKEIQELKKKSKKTHGKRGKPGAAADTDTYKSASQILQEQNKRRRGNR